MNKLGDKLVFNTGIGPDKTLPNSRKDKLTSYEAYTDHNLHSFSAKGSIVVVGEFS